MFLDKTWLCLLPLTIYYQTVCAAEDYNILHQDGSYQFGYDNPDSYHHSQANRNNIVRGEFGARNPKTGIIDSTQYTAGPRGFRPRGKNIVRKYDLNQAGPRPIGSRDDPYFDPNEDPSYDFEFRTRTYSRKEAANRLGDVTGKYTYLDDIGERHNVEYIAGKNTGFHVKTPFPDSNPRAYGPLYYNGRGRPIPRGRTSIQRGLDGSYRFISAGPDQRRTETSDATGHVRGSYTYLDDKGVQHSVHYIAGPETGYRVLKNVKGPHLPSIFPFQRPEIIPPDFYDYPGIDDVFDTAASGHVKPSKPGGKPAGPNKGGDEFNFDNGSNISGGGSDFNNDFGKPGGTGSGDNTGIGGGSKPGGSLGGSKPNRPSYNDDDLDDLDLFGSNSGANKPSGNTQGSSSGGGSSSPFRPGGASGNDDGSYRPTGDNGSYKPSGSDGFDKPTGSSGNNFGPPTGVSGSDNFGKPTGSSENNFGGSSGSSFGKPTGPTGGSNSKPNYDDFGGSNEVNDFNLFEDGSTKPTGSSGGSRPSGGSSSRPSGGGSSSSTTGSGTGSSGSAGGGTHIGISHHDSSGSYNDRGTIVTNVGDRLFSVPPGVSVRAHVQAIDLLPLGPRSPSPGDQLKADSQEELKAEPSNVKDTSDTNDAVADDSNNVTATLPAANTTDTLAL